MLIQELIDELKKYPQDRPVIIRFDQDYITTVGVHPYEFVPEYPTDQPDRDDLGRKIDNGIAIIDIEM